MSAALQRFLRKTGMDNQLMLTTLAMAKEVPAARMILDIAQMEHDAIIADALAHPKVDPEDVKQDVRWKLGEASGLKRLMDAVVAASELNKQS